jgi:hypothetical protein
METWALVILLGVAWGWHQAMKARELAMDEVRRTCGELEVRWLDESVSLMSMGLRRDDEGRLGVRRIYGFRYLEAGYLIREGVVMLHGDRVQSLLLDTSRLPS